MRLVMVLALVILTILLLVVLDLFLKKEERDTRSTSKARTSPIFLSPEKSLKPIINGKKRFYHPSHTWFQKENNNWACISLDDFISTLFSSTVKIENLPFPDTYISQGLKIWDLSINGRSISQLSPISGKVLEINPACKLGIPLPTQKVGNSWIVKILPSSLEKDSNNLLPYKQASIVNNALEDELVLFAQKDHYLNDGGEIDPSFISTIDDKTWEIFVNKFFPYQSAVA